jgi:hypothetical protein
MCLHYVIRFRSDCGQNFCDIYLAGLFSLLNFYFYKEKAFIDSRIRNEMKLNFKENTHELMVDKLRLTKVRKLLR